MLKTNKKVSERILTFDLLRGYFLCVILLNHLQYYPSGLDLLTGRGILYVSTAEGFFAVSGIVLGIIRGRKLIDAPLKTAARLLWKRGFQLYLTSIILTLLFTFIGWFFLGNEGLKYGIYASWTGFGDLLWQTLTFQYTYGWADFLRYYALFLFASPAALWLLRKGYWYILMSASLLVWSLYPFSPFASDYSQPISWQIIFFGGLTIGYYWPVLVDMWNKISLRRRKIISISLISTTAITMFISVLLVFGHNFGGELGMQLTAIHNIVEQYFDKDRLPLTRVLLGFIWFWALFIVVRKYEAIIIKKVGRFILPLGENSLYVYTIQAFIVFFAHLFIIKPTDTPGILINLTVSILALALVWLAVRTKFLMKIIPR